jgi:ACS family sodium-dependent inorganic phosphate cotransporter
MTLWNFHQTIPKRYLLSLLAFFGFFNAYILRSNLSIAIITMVKPTIHISLKNITITQPIGYDWNTKAQGYILSSFFYGYTIIQIPAGFLATTLGGKFLFGGSVGITALLTLLTPLCAQMGPTALIILRALEGLSSVS